LNVKNRAQDSLHSVFYASKFLRDFYLADNYQKVIVEVRKDIEKYEQQFVQNLNSDIFSPSDSCAEIGFRIIKLIDKRNELIIEATKTAKSLVKEGLISRDTYTSSVISYQEKIKE